jgi:cyclopropane fatty-acyl-phospholipid synthase-like methyltransferase
VGDLNLGTFAFDALAYFSLCQTIFGAHQAGMWTPFEENLDYELDPESFAERAGKDARLVRGTAEYLARRQIFEVVGGAGKTRFRLAPMGRTMVGDEWLPYFVFYIGGYGQVLGQSGAMMNHEVAYGKDLKRSGHYVALGSELMGRTRHARSYEAVFARANVQKPDLVLDLGCGSAGFLIQLVQKSNAKAGIGIDLSGPACELGRKNIAAAGLADRVRVFEGDARKLLSTDPQLRGQVDLITAMFLIHEFFGEGFDAAATKLRDLTAALKPGTGRLIIMDKHTDILEQGGAPAYFTEFKLVHDFTDQVLCTKQQWHEVLGQAGLEITHEHPLAPHTGSILLECRVAK